MTSTVDATVPGFHAVIPAGGAGPRLWPLSPAGSPSARHAAGFTEKPDAETAAAYLATGEYRWNAGMFIVRAQVLLDHLAAQLPALHRGLLDLAAAWDTPQRAEVLAATWPGLTK